jgi:hypothetical protein
MAKRRQPLVLGIALLLVFVLVSLAWAETTRSDYIAAAEPICKANTDANRHTLRGARAKAKSGKLGAAGRQFTRAARAFSATVDQIAALPQPSADTLVLSRWIGYLRLESGYLTKVAVALKHGQANKAQGFAVRLNRNANFANQTVAGYGFSSCLINPSQFI